MFRTYNLPSTTWTEFYNLWNHSKHDPEELIAQYKSKQPSSSKTTPEQERKYRHSISADKLAHNPFLVSLISKIQFPHVIQDGRVNVESALKIITEARSIQEGCVTFQFETPSPQVSTLMKLLEKRIFQFHEDTEAQLPDAIVARVEAIADAIFDPFIDAAANPQAIGAAKTFKEQFSKEFLQTLEERVSILVFDLLKAAILGEDSLKSFDDNLLKGANDPKTPNYNAELKLREEWKNVQAKVIVPLDDLIDSLLVPAETPIDVLNWTIRYNDVTEKIKNFRDQLSLSTDPDVIKILKRKESPNISLRVQTTATGATSADLSQPRLSIYREISTPLFGSKALTPKDQVSYANFVMNLSAESLRELARTPKKFPELFFPPASELTKENTLRALLEQRESLATTLDLFCNGGSKLAREAEALELAMSLTPASLSLKPTVTLSDEEIAYAKRLLAKLDIDLITRLRQSFHAHEEPMKEEERTDFETRFSGKGDKRLMDKLQAAVCKVQADRYEKFTHLRTVEDWKAAMEYSKGFNKLLTDLYVQALASETLNDVFLRNWTAAINDWRNSQ